MRKALIAVAVASALFAVGAFAATFDVTSSDVASGTDDVGSCAAEALVDFTTGAYDSGLSDFTVVSATVTFVDAAGDPTGACDDSVSRLAIDSNGTWSNYGPSNVDSNQASFTISPALPVGPIDNVSVVVEGFTIPATPV